MGAVDFGSQGISYFLVSGKFFALIESNGFARFAFQKLSDNFQKGICMLSGEFPCQSDKASGSMFSEHSAFQITFFEQELHCIQIGLRYGRVLC
jgi:hypothetical protein